MSWLCVEVFFFSSRRRHTRLQGDWSSDVCSSDLRVDEILRGQVVRHQEQRHVADDLRARRHLDNVAEQEIHLGIDFADLMPAGSQPQDRKSTRLNSSHLVISYAVFCLKKKIHATL